MQIFKRDPGTNDPFGGLELGDEVMDTLTSFTGIIIATNQNISGCDQLCIQPPVKDGTYQDAHWFDVERIGLLSKSKVKMTARRTGADSVPPSRSPVA